MIHRKGNSSVWIGMNLALLVVVVSFCSTDGMVSVKTGKQNRTNMIISLIHPCLAWTFCILPPTNHIKFVLVQRSGFSFFSSLDVVVLSDVPIDGNQFNFPLQTGIIRWDPKQLRRPAAIPQDRWNFQGSNFSWTHLIQTLINTRYHVATAQHHLIGLSRASKGRCIEGYGSTVLRSIGGFVVDFQKITTSRLNGASRWRF